MGKYTNELSKTKMIGIWKVPDGDQMVTRKLGDGREENPKYEKKYRKTILKGLKSKKTFIDVGANVGMWSLPMSSEFENVISFEPDVRNMECLRENTSRKTNIEYRTEGVGINKSLSIIKQSVKNCGNSFVLPADELVFDGEPELGKEMTVTIASNRNKKGSNKSTEATVIEVVSIDSLELSDVDLIKIDTQGSEFPILKGATKTIKKCQPWLCFELGTKHTIEANGYTDDDMLKYLYKLDYVIELKSRTDCIMRPKRYNGKKENDIFEKLYR